MHINILCPDSALGKLENCLPAGSRQIGNIEISVNGNKNRYDGIAVLQSTIGYGRKELSCKEGNALLIVREPQDILRMPQRYINQFDHVLTPNGKVQGLNTIYSQFGQLWTINNSYSSLAAMTVPEKTKVLSTVTSLKTDTRGHQYRLTLCRRIQKEFNDCFDWYGRGIHEIDDKWVAIAPYRYHLVFENSRWDHYWTEKLTDAYLGFSKPIYIGCPNIMDYFPENSLSVLSHKSVDLAISQLRRVLEADAYAKSLAPIIIARNKTIHEYSFFHVLIGIVNQYFENTDRYKAINLCWFENTAYRHHLKMFIKRTVKQLIRKKQS